MSGFRDPDASEHRAIARHVRNTYAKSVRPMVFWQYFFTTAAAMFILNLLVFSADKPLGANVIYAVFVIASAAAAYLTTASLKKGRAVFRKVTNGEYQVMECRAYDVSYNAEQVSTGALMLPMTKARGFLRLDSGSVFPGSAASPTRIGMDIAAFFRIYRVWDFTGKPITLQTEGQHLGLLFFAIIL